MDKAHVRQLPALGDNALVKRLHILLAALGMAGDGERSEIKEAARLIPKLQRYHTTPQTTALQFYPNL